MKLIYETELTNGKKILTDNIEEIVDTINEYELYENEKKNNTINKIILINHIKRNKCYYLTNIKKTPRLEWFKNYWKEHNTEHLYMGTNQNINNHIRKTYIQLKLKLYEENRKLI